MNLLTAAVVLAWIAILVLAFAVSGLSRAVGRMASEGIPTRRTHPLIGRLAPAPRGVGPWMRRTILIFVDPTCTVCLDRIEELKTLDSSIRQGSDWILAATESPGAFRGIELDGLSLVQVNADYVAHFGAYSKPFGVVIDSEGRVVNALPLGNTNMLKELVATSADERTGPHA